MTDDGVDFVLRYKFPAALARELVEARPDLTWIGAERSVEALRAFLAACALARPGPQEPLAVTSAVVDEAWQQFILMTAEYRDFCRGAYDAFLHRELVSHADGDHSLHGVHEALAGSAQARADTLVPPPRAAEQRVAAELDGREPAASSAGGTGTVAVAVLSSLTRTSGGLKDFLWKAAGYTVTGGSIVIAASLADRVDGALSFLAFAAGIVVVPLAAAIVVLLPLSGLQHAHRLKTIRRYEFPREVSAEIERRHPHLTPSDVSCVLEGLRQFLLACLANRKADSRLLVGMPSRVVDDAWRAFVVQTRSYEDFCRRGFGAYLNHTPRSSLPVSMLEAYANTARRLRSMSAGEGASGFGSGGRHRRRDVAPEATGAGALPTLFAIDAALGLNDGHTFDGPTAEEIVRRSNELETSGDAHWAHRRSGDNRTMWSGFGGDGDGGGGDGAGDGGGGGGGDGG